MGTPLTIIAMPPILPRIKKPATRALPQPHDYTQHHRE
jgi:hypothetical protein